MRRDGAVDPARQADREASTRDRAAAALEGGDWSFADRLGDMISAHAPDGTYRYASAAARGLLGYHPTELIGTWAYDYFHPDDVSKVSVAHRSALGGAPFTVSYRLRHKNDKYVWVETTNRIVTEPDSGEVVEILCCTRAIEHRDEVEPLDEDGRHRCLARVRAVLDEESVTAVFQPIVELGSERRIAYEALARFPGSPAHTPDRWFADAWRVGLGIPLELLAAKVAAAALPQLPLGTGLTINASPPAVAAEGFLSCFSDDAERVAIEITEHLRLDDYAHVGTQLSALRDAGGKVAIDDFGAGYASLRHVLSMRPEWIKLDISLTERIDSDPVATALAAAMVSFADRIGSNLIAEGIESAAQASALDALGIRFGQGYFFGRPAPLDEALAETT
jgi:PAS domain S-box-containing protein